MVKQGEVGRKKISTSYTLWYNRSWLLSKRIGMSYGFNVWLGGLLIKDPGIRHVFIHCHCFNSWYSIFIVAW